MNDENEKAASLQRLADFISEKANSDIITRYALEQVIQQNEAEILDLLSPIIEVATLIQKEKSMMDAVWKLLYEKENIYTVMNSDFQLIRNVVTSPNNFNTLSDSTSKSTLINSRGIVRGMAEVRNLNEESAANDSMGINPIWLDLVDKTLSSLDEFTADLFDLISYLWVVSPKNESGYFKFESDYALRLRFDNPMGEEFKVRERERFSIMRRIAALSNIWISMRDYDENEADYDDTGKLLKDERNNYDFKTFMSLLEVDGLQMAYDKKTGKAKGIYSLQIRPTAIMERYLTTSTQTFGPLDMKVFKFHHITQREHKRLTRFLNYQWKLRKIRRTGERTFKVGILDEVMNIAVRIRFNERMAIFRKVLNELVEHGVIKDWHYEEEFDETELIKRGGLKTWLDKIVYITPPDAISTLNNEKTLIDDVKASFKKTVNEENTQMVLNLIQEQAEENSSLTNEEKIQKVAVYMNENKIALRTISASTGISTATLMRYIKGTVKRMKQPTIDTLYAWYKEQQNNKG